MRTRMRNDLSRAAEAAPEESGSRSAAVVFAGILISRLLGLVRNTLFARYFGAGAEADAFNAAFKIPGLLRNLLGEGTLSASFVPVYSRLLARADDGRRERARGRRARVPAGGRLGRSHSSASPRRRCSPACLRRGSIRRARNSPRA